MSRYLQMKSTTLCLCLYVQQSQNVHLNFRITPHFVSVLLASHNAATQHRSRKEQLTPFCSTTANSKSKWLLQGKAVFSSFCANIYTMHPSDEYQFNLNLTVHVFSQWKGVKSGKESVLVRKCQLKMVLSGYRCI